MSVAKAGILLFADYIHNAFIEVGGWIESTWDWVMNLIGKSGWTLVNVVGAIWSVASATISAVKNAATAALNAVKAGLQFIMDAVLGLIIQGIVSALNLVLESFLLALTSMTSLQYSKQNGLFYIEEYAFGVKANGFGLDLYVGEHSVGVTDLFSPSSPEFETLSANNLMLASSSAHLIHTGLLSYIGGSDLRPGIVLTITNIMLQLGSVLLQGLDIEESDRYDVSVYYLFLAISTLGTGLLSFSSRTSSSALGYFSWVIGGYAYFVSSLAGFAEGVKGQLILSGGDVEGTMRSIFARFDLLILNLITGIMLVQIAGMQDQTNSFVKNGQMAIFNLASSLIYWVLFALYNYNLL